MKVKLFSGGDFRVVQNQVNEFLESLMSDNPKETDRVIDIKFGDHEAFSVMVVYK